MLKVLMKHVTRPYYAAYVDSSRWTKVYMVKINMEPNTSDFHKIS